MCRILLYCLLIVLFTCSVAGAEIAIKYFRMLEPGQRVEVYEVMENYNSVPDVIVIGNEIVEVVEIKEMI